MDILLTQSIYLLGSASLGDRNHGPCTALPSHSAEAGGGASSRQVQGPGTECKTFQNGYTALILWNKKKKKKKAARNLTVSLGSIVGV